MAISGEQVDAVANFPMTWTIDNILRATFACDYARAAVFAFARARTGENVPAQIVARRGAHRSDRARGASARPSEDIVVVVST